MKRPFILSLICLSALAICYPAFAKNTPPAPAAKKTGSIKSSKPQNPPEGALKPSSYNLSMIQLTSAAMYRYGREMFLKGNDTEAARVFLNIIKLDCGNKVAQYHLRKIAARTPALAFLNGKLDLLPCKPYDFSKEDLLPASMYYDNDPDLLLEQLISDRNRHRLNEQEMNAKIDQYAVMINELESTVNSLKQTLERSTSPAAIDKATIDLLEAGRKTAGNIEKEISLLKNQIASRRIDYQKEVQDMRTRLAEADVHLNAAPPPSQPPAKTPAYSDNAKGLVDAMSRAKAQLADRERALAEKDRALIPLQERFDAIESRLRTIQSNLQNIQKP